MKKKILIVEDNKDVRNVETWALEKSGYEVIQTSTAQKGISLAKDKHPDLILMASGSEVDLALKSADLLEKENINVRVVSFPSWEIFEMQSDEYKKSVLPDNIETRIAIEAGVTFGWHKYTGLKGFSIGIDKFGASAPQNLIFKNYGFSVRCLKY